MENEIENYNPYCEICDACGESGCCPPTQCDVKEGGKYCEWYLKELRISYLTMEEFVQHLYDTKNEELIELFHKIEDKIESNFK